MAKNVKARIKYVKQRFTMRQPRIELGAQRWQRWILPLNHWHLMSQSQLLPIYKHYLLHARLQPTYTNTIFVPQHTVRNNTKHLVEYLDYYLLNHLLLLPNSKHASINNQLIPYTCTFIFLFYFPRP